MNQQIITEPAFIQDVDVITDYRRTRKRGYSTQPARERRGAQILQLILPTSVGCTLVPVTCYLASHDGDGAEGNDLGLDRVCHVPRASTGGSLKLTSPPPSSRDSLARARVSPEENRNSLPDPGRCSQKGKNGFDSFGDTRNTQPNVEWHREGTRLFSQLVQIKQS